jgi:nucleotide-binding universal stress UspA family protein
MLRMNAILYATDFSDSSKIAFPLACSLARDHGSRLIVLHVVATGTYEIANLAQLGQGESRWQFEDRIRRMLEEFQPPDGRVAVECKLAEGDPAASIIKAAEETGSDLIVLGTHGRTGFRRVLMGSVAEHVMRSAPCPVLVVKGAVPETGNSSVAR